MLKLMISFLALAVLFVAARFWSRRYRKAPIGPDDYMIVVALVYMRSLSHLALYIDKVLIQV